MTSDDDRPIRRGGRAGRRSAAASAPVAHHPALMSQVPVFEVANAEGVEMIHDFAMRVIEEICVEFRDAEALDIWRRTDAEITGERVRVSRETLLALVAKAPEAFTHHARNPDRSVRVGGSSKVVAPSYGAPFVLDLDGGRRHATLDDLNMLQKLNHMAPSVHIAGGPIVEPVDTPVETRHLHMALSALTCSDKPIIGNVTSRERAEDTVAMCDIVFGSDFARNNCCTTSLINSNSPLVWDKTMLDALKVYAANGHAVLCSPFSMAGASTPASSVGTIGLVTAEALMAIAFGQLVRPGAPMLFGVPSMAVDLSTGAPMHGSPETAMVQFLAGQMARRYGVPHRALLNSATSKTPDLQAGFDSMWATFPSFLAGAHWLSMAGGLIEGTLAVSVAKMMIDFEQVDAFYHFCQGPSFDDLDEIFAMVREVGPGGHFLGEAHTRKAQLFRFPSQNNAAFEQWEADGRKDSAQTGADKARDWLARYEEPPIRQSLREELDEFVKRAESRIAGTGG